VIESADLARRVAEEVRQLTLEVERARATAASLSGLPSLTAEAKARREHRRLLAGARRPCLPTGTLSSRFNARRADERDWWCESDDPPPPPPGPSAGEIYRRRKQQ
jgi:hypothetical protein